LQKHKYQSCYEIILKAINIRFWHEADGLAELQVRFEPVADNE